MQTPAAKKAAKNAGKKQSKDATPGPDSGSALDSLQQLLSKQGRAAATSSVQEQPAGTSDTGGGGATSAINQAQSQPTQTAGTAALDAAALKKELHEKLTKTQASQDALPDSPEFQTIRMQIEAERESYKESLKALRPVGSRLDSAKQSLKTMRENAEVLRQAQLWCQGIGCGYKHLRRLLHHRTWIR